MRWKDPGEERIKEVTTFDKENQEPGGGQLGFICGRLLFCFFVLLLFFFKARKIQLLLQITVAHHLPSSASLKHSEDRSDAKAFCN